VGGIREKGRPESTVSATAALHPLKMAEKFFIMYFGLQEAKPPPCPLLLNQARGIDTMYYYY
jgi:hypothetical protein